MDSRLSGLELCVSIRRENFRREKKLKKKIKENFILMDSCLSGLERSIIFLGMSIRRIRYRKKIEKKK